MIVFCYLQLRNLVWATSKHDVYLMSHHSIIHWSALTCKKTVVLNVSGHVAPREVNAFCRIMSFEIHCVFLKECSCFGHSSLWNLFNWSYTICCLLLQKHPGSLLEGFSETQVSTLAVKDKLLIAGGFQGELICKVSFFPFRLPCTLT